MLAVMLPVEEIVTVSFEVLHPELSVTVTMYEPAQSPETV
jgi:hypothetical protein